MRSLRGLVLVLTWEMQQRASTALTIGKDLAKATAHFLCDLLSIMDRGVVFKLVRILAFLTLASSHQLVNTSNLNLSPSLSLSLLLFQCPSSTSRLKR